MILKTCNMCGKQFNYWDYNDDYSIYLPLGFGSQHDTDTLDVSLCCDCCDKVVDYFVANCKISPLNMKPDFVVRMPAERYHKETL